MSSLEDSVELEEQALLTMREATKILRVGRSLGYALAHEYLSSGGRSGLPVIRFSKEGYRVPRWALIELVTTGRVVRLCDAETSVEGASVAR